jgi:DNA-binding transcriptional LysR family regulator
MNYTLNQLRIYLKITQTLSITKAANELNLTQPALSIQLKNFQQQFEYPLIEVIQKKIHVTGLGKEIAKAAESIINEVDNINYTSQNYKNKLAGHLKISIISTGKYIMPFFLNSFLKENEKIDLTMDVTNKSKVLKSLAENEIDFALVSDMPENINVAQYKLIENTLYLFGNKEIDIKKPIDQILEKTSIIFREIGSDTNEVMDKFFKKLKIQPRKKLELTSNEAVKQAVIAGLGISIMPLIGSRNEIETGHLKIIPAPGLPIKTTWRLIWLKEKKLSPIAASYLTYLETNLETITKKFNQPIKIKK